MIMNCAKTAEILPSIDEILNKADDVCPVQWAVNVAETAMKNTCGKGTFCRDGLKQLYLIGKDITLDKGTMEDIELLPMAENGYQAVASAVLYHPDVLILDMEMESRDAGLKAGQQVLSILPETKIIMLTVYDDDATIFRAYEMGAVDYLFKNASTEKIHEAILDAYRGTSPIRQEIAQRMRQEFRRL